MTKFADATYLLVGSRNIRSVMDECDNIKKYTRLRRKELVAFRARSRLIHLPLQPFIEGLERVSTLKVLGVTMTDHDSQVLSTCSSSMFALRLLRSHGLQQQELPPGLPLKHPSCMLPLHGGGLRVKSGP